MNKVRVLAVFVLLALLINTVPVLAQATGTDRYVATTGTNGGACTNSASPCATINYAIGQAASSGDTVYVAAGVYTGTGSYVVNVNSKSVWLRGGWNDSYSSQAGYSVIDAQKARIGMAVYASVTMDHFVITNGDKGRYGGSDGGMVVSGTLILTNSAVVNNNGDGIRAGSGTTQLLNTTITGNAGSGIFLFTGSVDISNSTITNNRGDAGGGIENYAGTVTVQNSIVANNTAIGYYPPLPGDLGDCSGSITATYSIFQSVPSSCGLSNGGHLQTGIDPKLGSFLQGFYVQPLRSTSPAINAGNPSTCAGTDQRGMARVGTCDMGAFEYMTPGALAQLVAIAGSGQHTHTNGTFNQSLVAAVVDANGNPVPSVSVTFTAPSSGPSGLFSGGAFTANATSDAGGLATAPSLTANNQPGAFNMQASAGAASPASFSLQILAWYVAQGGSDSNDCISPTTPCATIQGATNKASDGDVIEVAAQTFTASAAGVSIYKNLTVSGGWNTDFTSVTGNTILDAPSQYCQCAIYVGDGAVVVVRHFTVQNVNNLSGTGVRVGNSTLTLVDSTIQNNMASTGAGLKADSSTVTLDHVTVSGNSTILNTTNSGAGIYMYGGTLNINNSTLSGNTSTGAGGGIYAYTATVNINDSIVAQNTATMDGAGIYVSGDELSSHGQLHINRSAVVGNSGGNQGGGVYVKDSAATIHNTTVKGNSAVYGGGMFVHTGTLDIGNATIAENTASQWGGGLDQFGNGTITIHNSILADNTAGSGLGPDCHQNSADAGHITVLDHTLVEDPAGCLLPAGLGNIEGVNPDGMTYDPMGRYYVLAASSPALDAGNAATCLSEDQRGVSRPQGPACDMGAYELVYYTISGNSGISAATLSYNNNGVKTIATGGNGSYSLSVPEDWSGTVTPSKPGYDFSPTSMSYSDVGASQTAQDYSATPNGLLISGNAGVGGALLSYTYGTPQTTTADGSGNYSLSIPSGWTGTVTPSKNCYTFTPASRDYTNVQSARTAQDFGATLIPGSICTSVGVSIGGTARGNYPLAAHASTRQSYIDVDAGPVQVRHGDGVTPIIASERINLKSGAGASSYSEFMGVPGSKVSDTYLFPWYNNATAGGVSSELRFATVGGPTTVTVTIAGVDRGAYPLGLNGSARVTYTDLDNGPVQIKSSDGVPIVASVRVQLKKMPQFSSFTELLGLSASSTASTKYMFPWYNNASSGGVDSQLRFGNVGGNSTTVTVKIGGVVQNSYSLDPNQSLRISYTNIDNGPVEISSTGGVPIIAAERINLKTLPSFNSYTELMGLPGVTLTETRYVFPVYTDTAGSGLEGQLRFGNVGAGNTTVTVKIGGTVRGTYDLIPNQSQRIAFSGLDTGPVEVYTTNGVPIIASMRVNMAPNATYSSNAEMMGLSMGTGLGLPGNQLSSSYWFPWYNNATYGGLDSQLRFGVP